MIDVQSPDQANQLTKLSIPPARSIMPRSFIKMVFDAWKMLTMAELAVEDGIISGYAMFTVTRSTAAQPPAIMDTAVDE